MPSSLSPRAGAAAVFAAASITACATPSDHAGGPGAVRPAPVDYRTSVAAPAKPCAALADFARADLEILWATEKPATDALPAHCEVRGLIAPAVNIRVQLPDAWNGRFYMAGNGGLAGEPVDDRTGPGGDPTAEALRRGFAAAVTDTGHDRREVADASFAADRQLLIDYAYRAVHETAEAGKALARDYYGVEAITASYWEGCSTGGRQGLMSAQRFPEDFDGVIAGAPISDYTGTVITTFWTTERAERARLTERQLALAAAAYDAKCDALDGLEDGLVSRFEACDFEASEDLALCAGPEAGDDCLTAEQAALLDEIVAGPSANGASLHAGLPISSAKAVDGAPSQWIRWWIGAPGQTPGNLAIHASSMEYMVFDPPRPGYDWRAFDFESDPALLDELSAIIDATDPDLDAFRERGGKLLMYHGAADPGLVVGMSIDYRDAVFERYGDAASELYRLFALPGMHHCRGGYGPSQVDYLEAIVQWVEGGRAPDGLVARQLRDGEVVRERPLCDYPAYARYEGGDPGDASSFVCATP